jgi:hypothetical protein
MKGNGLMTGVLALFFFCQGARAQWSTPQRLTWNSGYSQFPVVAVDSSGRVHVSWQDDTPGNFEIFYKRSADGGGSWAAAERFTWDSAFSHMPAIAVDFSDVLHILWDDEPAGNNEIYHKKSTDAGANWTANLRLTWTSTYSFVPAVAVDSAHNLHLVWSDYAPGNFEIYHKKSTDGGSTWTAGQRLTWNAGASISPKIGAGPSGHLHVVWQDNTPGHDEVYYKRSTDGGSTWSASQRLTWSSTSSAYPEVGVDSWDWLHVVWQGSASGNTEALYRKSTNGGTTWTASRRLSWTSGVSFTPMIAVDSSDNLHVVWSDDTPGNFEIYYKKSTDGGENWTANERLTWTSDYSWNPAVAVDALGDVHVVWEDTTPGNWEIYYKSGK